MIQLIATPIKLQIAGLNDFFHLNSYIYSPTRAPKKGPITIPHNQKNIHMKVPITAPHIQYLDPQNFLVAKTGRKLSNTITMTTTKNQKIKNRKEKILHAIKWNIKSHK
jgi:hypothetical protein